MKLYLSNSGESSEAETVGTLENTLQTFCRHHFIDFAKKEMTIDASMVIFRGFTRSSFPRKFF